MSLRHDNLLSEHFRETRRQVRSLLLKVWGGGLLIVLLGFSLAWFTIQPAPPRSIVIATGSQQGAYYHFAKRYAAYLRQHGVNLELRPTAGSVENYGLLQSDPQVNLAIVQGGTVPEEMRGADNIESLASLYFEPVWVFYRGDEPHQDLRDLRDKRIAIGQPGSGTESMALLLLGENGVDAASGASFVRVGGTEAVEQLKSGQIDAAFFVTSPHAKFIRDLFGVGEIRLLSFDRHAAYARRHPFLTSVTLERGVIDLQRDFPREDVLLVAPAANLIATSSLHDALIPLLLRAASEVHSGDGGALQQGQMPSTEFVEFPLNDSARRYFESGPPFLQKYLPFWVASAVDRGKILLLPALTLLLPLCRVAPPLYRWRIRSRIYRWYEILRGIEADLRSQQDAQTLAIHASTLSAMEGELDDLRSVPLAYMQEFYNLRLHVEFVERRVKQVLSAGEPPAAEPTDQADATEHTEPTENADDAEPTEDVK